MNDTTDSTKKPASTNQKAKKAAQTPPPKKVLSDGEKVLLAARVVKQSKTLRKQNENAVIAYDVFDDKGINDVLSAGLKTASSGKIKPSSVADRLVEKHGDTLLEKHKAGVSLDVLLDVINKKAFGDVQFAVTRAMLTNALKKKFGDNVLTRPE